MRKSAKKKQTKHTGDRASSDKVVVLVSSAMYKRLQHAARLHHVPVPLEIEQRFEIMLSNEDFAARIFGGEDTLQFLMRIAGAICRAEQRLGRRWFSDYNAVIETKAAVMQEMSDHVLVEQIGGRR